MEISKWEFKKEFTQLVIDSSKLKESTAKKKASALFYKYEDIFQYYLGHTDGLSKTIDKQAHIIRILKKGIIDYHNGFIVLNDVSQIDKRNDSIIVTLKNGREVSFTKQFDYLLDLF